jgi:hypothetical protein
MEGLGDFDFGEPNDFGFTSFAEEDIDQQIETKSKEGKRKMLALIEPLLKQLMKDADKNPNIHWPGREKVLSKLLTELQKLADN